MLDHDGPAPIFVDGAWVAARSETRRQILNPATGPYRNRETR
jgi:hypothetical protein